LEPAPISRFRGAFPHLSRSIAASYEVAFRDTLAPTGIEPLLCGPGRYRALTKTLILSGFRRFTVPTDSDQYRPDEEPGLSTRRAASDLSSMARGRDANPTWGFRYGKVLFRQANLPYRFPDRSSPSRPFPGPSVTKCETGPGLQRAALQPYRLRCGV
jgi:hypothetical protein